MIDPRDTEPRDEVVGEIRLNLGGEDDSVAQGESAVREESIAVPEFEFDPANPQIVEDLESREIAGVIADDRMPGDMRLGEVSVSEEGLSLPVDVGHPVNDPAPPEVITEEPRELVEVEAELDQRWPETKVDPSLERIEMLMDILDHPERVTPVIHIVGTNGKTSTIRMIESLVRALGRRTDRITSPHLQLVTECTITDGQSIHPHDYVRIWRETQPYVEMVDAKSVEKGGLQVSKFEALAAMAYATFADAPVDVVVVEVGTGGTWGATNVVEADVAVIYPTGLDHTEYLGDTLAEIASERAGITKLRRNEDNSPTPPDNVAIVGEQEPEAMDAVLRRAMEMDVSVARAGIEYGVVSHQLAVGGQNLTFEGLIDEYDDIYLSLHGPHQARSAVTALAAMEAFLGAGPGRPLNTDAVHEGFVTVASPGHLERARSTPTAFIGAAYNPHGVRVLRTALSAEFGFRRIIGVLPVLGEKDARGLLVELGPYFEEAAITQNTSPRALHHSDLVDLVEEIFGEERVHRVPTLPSAVELVVALTEETDIGDGIVSGSGVVVAESVAAAGEAQTLFGKDPQ